MFCFISVKYVLLRYRHILSFHCHQFTHDDDDDDDKSDDAENYIMLNVACLGLQDFLLEKVRRIKRELAERKQTTNTGRRRLHAQTHRLHH